MEPAWIQGLGGGLLIGLAAAMHLLLNGRIAGTTGMLQDMLSRPRSEPGRISLLYLLGAFLAAGSIASLGWAPALDLPASPWLLILSGLLVGIGTALANGCTSGHGVCGLSRLSRRSIIATACFMAATALMVAVKHLIGDGSLP